MTTLTRKRRSPSYPHFRVHGLTIDQRHFPARNYDQLYYSTAEMTKLSDTVSSKSFREWAHDAGPSLSADLIQHTSPWQPATMFDLLGWDLRMLDKSTPEGVKLERIILQRLYYRMFSIWQRRLGAYGKTSQPPHSQSIKPDPDIFVHHTHTMGRAPRHRSPPHEMYKRPKNHFLMPHRRREQASMRKTPNGFFTSTIVSVTFGVVLACVTGAILFTIGSIGIKWTSGASAYLGSFAQALSPVGTTGDRSEVMSAGYISNISAILTPTTRSVTHQLHTGISDNILHPATSRTPTPNGGPRFHSQLPTKATQLYCALLLIAAGLLLYSRRRKSWPFQQSIDQVITLKQEPIASPTTLQPGLEGTEDGIHETPTIDPVPYDRISEIFDNLDQRVQEGPGIIESNEI